MKVRHKEKGYLGYASEFNPHGLGEIIVGFDEGDMDSMFIKDFDVQLPDGSWKDMSDAFRDHDIIPDKYNLHFSVPATEAERTQGWY